MNKPLSVFSLSSVVKNIFGLAFLAIWWLILYGLKFSRSTRASSAANKSFGWRSLSSV
jgi:hypothetical protein